MRSVHPHPLKHVAATQGKKPVNVMISKGFASHPWNHRKPLLSLAFIKSASLSLSFVSISIYNTLYFSHFNGSAIRVGVSVDVCLIGHLLKAVIKWMAHLTIDGVLESGKQSYNSWPQGQE